jgi:hypothetical protein
MLRYAWTDLLLWPVAILLLLPLVYHLVSLICCALH